MRTSGKPSALEYTLEQIRAGIASGEWGDCMPSERRLSELLRVGRNSVHAALQELQGEGVLEVVRKRNRIRSGLQRRPGGVNPARVAILTSARDDKLPSHVLLTIAELRHRLAGQGLSVDVFSMQGVRKGGRFRWAAEITTRHPARLWVLYQAAEDLQHWFQDQRLQMCLLGSCAAGIRAPMIDLDQAAVARHAIYTLLRKGHAPDRITLVRQDRHLAGTEVVEHTFRDCIRAEGGKPDVQTCPVDPEANRRLLDRLRRRASPPTALLFERALTALTFHGHAHTRHGLVLPRDLAMLCLSGEDRFLSHTVPALSHYAFDPASFARKAATLIQAALSMKSASSRVIRMIPDLVKGETI